MTPTPDLHTRARPRRNLLLVIAAAAIATATFALARPLLGNHTPDATTQAVERLHTPPGMVYIPGGNYLTGTDDPDADDDQKPMRRRFVPSFYIDRTEVTNREYARFRPDHPYPANEADLPVTDVTYDEAAGYAAWSGKRLPTEDEWEKAARGTDGRRYPWGNDWNPARVAARRPNSNNAGAIPKAPPLPYLSETPSRPGGKAVSVCRATAAVRVRPVGSVAAGASPYGCLDMAGNAWEWVQGHYRGNPNQRILRGGAVGYGERSCRTYSRAVEGSGAT